MATFIFNRLAQTIVVVLAAALVSFALLRYVGDPVNNMVGQSATLAEREAMRQALGLDDPVAFQFLRFIRTALSGDLGISYRFGVPVKGLLLERLPARSSSACWPWSWQARSAFRSAYGQRCTGEAS